MVIQQLSMGDTAGLGLYASKLTATGDATKLHDNAVEFEALLIGQVLDKLEHSVAQADGDGSDPARDTVSSLGTHAVAQTLAERHAFGFADMIQGAVSARASTPATEASPK
ncbi:MAG TPA: hypothetical protein VMU24_10815 [Candidatus Acidoferrales bacterium]|nr:hypothetical protein [Candidatus Acidoferrales bacterium]